MGVEAEDLKPFNLMSDDDIFSVIRKARLAARVDDPTVGGAKDGIDGFVSFVTLNSANVGPFMKLITRGPHATKRSTRPRFTRRANEEGVVAVLF